MGYTNPRYVSDEQLFFGRGRRVVGQLLLFQSGALHSDFVEEDARSDDRLRNGSERVRDVGIVACGDNAGAKAAVVEFVEGRSANELAGAVGTDAIEEPGIKLPAESFDGIDVFALLFCHGEQAFV